MKRKRIGFALILICFISLGCVGGRSRLNHPQAGNNPSQATEEHAAVGLPTGRLPASYTGVLPCADCPGIRYTLSLWPDRAYFLRMTYLGKGQGDGESFDDIGVWTLSPDEKTLTLRGGREAPVMFSIKTRDVLRKLDLQGNEIASKLTYDLVRREHFEWFEPRLSLRGMYMVMADAGLFQECLTGRKLPVAQEGENAKLESSYLKARRQPREQLLVNVEGRIALRSKMEGSGEEEMLVVERFIGVWPVETCGKPFSTSELEETYWKLTRLGDKPVSLAPGQREPHIVLRSEDRRLAGSGGCNRLIGGYELKGEELTFGQTATTRMACPHGMEMERAFVTALGQVKRWKITGEQLELLDAEDKLLARFQAIYLK